MFNEFTLLHGASMRAEISCFKSAWREVSYLVIAYYMLVFLLLSIETYYMLVFFSLFRPGDVLVNWSVIFGKWSCIQGLRYSLCRLDELFDLFALFFEMGCDENSWGHEQHLRLLFISTKAAASRNWRGKPNSVHYELIWTMYRVHHSSNKISVLKMVWR